MVLGGEILIAVGGAKFASVAPLVPLTAAAMSMPALFRTIAMSATYNNRRKIFVSSAIFVGCAYLVFCIGFLSFTNRGIYSPPTAMICAFMLPSTLMFGLSQFGKNPIKFPYVLMVEATFVAVAIAVPTTSPTRTTRGSRSRSSRRRDGPVALPALRPADHPPPPLGAAAPHRPIGAGPASALQFDQRAGLRAIGRWTDELHLAVLTDPGRHPRARLVDDGDR